MEGVGIMGSRYIIHVICPECGNRRDDVYYAPTCGITTWLCKCGHQVDLEKWTGISKEQASNRIEIENLIKDHDHH